MVIMVVRIKDYHERRGKQLKKGEAIQSRGRFIQKRKASGGSVEEREKVRRDRCDVMKELKRDRRIESWRVRRIGGELSEKKMNPKLPILKENLE